MRTMIAAILLTLCFPLVTTALGAQTSLGGLHAEDDLTAIWNALDMPAVILARRRNGPDTDQAILVYQRQGAVYAGLSAYGNRLEHLLTESADLVTDDGIKVGDQRAVMIQKRGEPEEITTEQPGTTECWYWSQGINFAVNDQSGSIENIFIFPAVEDGLQFQQVTVPRDTFEISHEYSDADRQAAIVGRISNKTAKAQHGVRVGITFYDRDRRIVDVVVADIGSLMPGSGFPFKASVQRKGVWSAYSVDYLVGDAAGGRTRQLIKAGKSGFATEVKGIRTVK